LLLSYITEDAYDMVILIFDLLDSHILKPLL
jgi:hypothetical protein